MVKIDGRWLAEIVEVKNNMLKYTEIMVEIKGRWLAHAVKKNKNLIGTSENHGGNNKGLASKDGIDKMNIC